MAFDDRHTEHFILLGWLMGSIGAGWPLSTDLGWFGVWRLAGIGVAAAGLAVLVIVCKGLIRVIEWWRFGDPES